MMGLFKKEDRQVSDQEDRNDDAEWEDDSGEEEEEDDVDQTESPDSF